MTDMESIELESCNAPIIRQLERLQHDCLSLQKKLKQKQYYLEYERLRWKLYAQQHGAAIYQDVTSTPAFNRHIILPFVELNSNYLFVRSKLIQMNCLTKDDITEMEAYVLSAANESESALAQLRFFPAFQQTHLTAATRHKQMLFQRRIELCDEINKVRHQYEETSLFYKKLHRRATMLSLIAIGLPVLIGGLMAHLITKIMTQVKLKELHKHRQEMLKQIKSDDHPGLDYLHDEIRMNEYLLIKQGFFMVLKERHHAMLMHVERYILNSG